MRIFPTLGTCARGILFLALALLAAPLSAQLPAFPGAEGYGAWARGGRGGDVYYVTTLAAWGPGSFAEGVAGAPAQGRTILFAVSGHIRLPSGSGGGLTIDKDRITVAGQSAPGDGICFWNNTMNVAASDLVFRHIRWRYGKQAAGGDCVDISGAATNVIIDHCDMLFATDENCSMFGSEPENLTFQWTCNAWGLQSHSAGGLWDIQHASAHHMLWAHNHTRNPKAIRPRALDWANNVIFGWDFGFNMAGADVAGTYRINQRGCYYIHGGSTTFSIYGGGTAPDTSIPFHLHMSDCALDGNNNGVLDVSRSNYAMVSAGAYNQAPTAFPQTVAANPAAPGDPVVGVPLTLDERVTAYKKVISQVGPLRLDVTSGRPLRDEVNALLVQDVVALNRRMISDPASLGLSGGAFATLDSVPAPVDGDRDGMPDFWETALGFNPAGDDHNTVFPGSGGVITGLTFFPTNSPVGYTYLEEYLNFLAIPHGTLTRNVAGAPTFLDVDLRKFTSGFTNAPVFTLSHVTNGTAVLQPDGFTARFTPTVDFFGRARFDFTVTDAAGSTWRQTLGILISPAGVPRSLVWAGDGASNDWDAAATNWLNGTNRVAFGVEDVVLFDDRGSASPAVDLSVPLAPGALTVNANQSYTIAGTGSLYGALALEKLGPGVLTLSTSNSFSGGTRIAGGRITLANDVANAHGLGTGPITFEGGTLRMYDNNSTFNGATYHLVVPAGSVGHLDADGRVDLYGTLTGAGTLNLKAPYVRTTLYGDWSGFGGRLNVSNATFQTFSTNGFGGATVALGPSAGLQYGGAVGSGGNVVEIGALSGEPTAALRGGTTGGGLVLTWAVGGLGTDAHFAGAAAEQDADSTTALRKVGAGTWTIGGVCTHRGGTTVSNGLLRINGALNESFLTVAAGATAGGTGSVRRGAYVGTGASLSPGDGITPAGTLTVSNGLTLAAPAMRFDLSSSPTGANDRIQLQGGLLTMSGTQNYLFTLLDNGLGAGTYTLITGGTNTAAAGVTLTHDLPAGTRQSFSVQRPASGNGQCYLRLVVTGNAAPLVWRGSADGTWGVNTATNWLNAGAGDRFYHLDHVLFDGAASVRTAAVLDVVQPGSFTVSNTTAFTLAGTGSIIGATTLLKAGAGTLTLTRSNAYAGGTFLDGGTIALANDTANARALGTGPITFRGGTLAMHSDDNTFNGATYTLVVPAGQTGSLLTDDRCDLYGTLAGGGTLNTRVTWLRTTLYGDWSAFTGRLNIVSDSGGGDLRIGSSYAWPGLPQASVHLTNHANLYHAGIVSSGAGTTIELGELSGTADSTLWGGETGWRILRWRIGGLGTDATFAGPIQERGADTITAIEKVGGGVWTLTGSSAYRGGTVVAAGTLLVNNTNGSGAGSGPVQVESGATLGGAGAIAGEVTLQGGASLRPGGGVGTLTIGEQLYVDPGTDLHFELGAASDHVAVGGDLNLAGALHVSDAGGFAGGIFPLFAYGGALDLGALTLASAPTGYLYSIETNQPGLVELYALTPFMQWQLAQFGSLTNPAAAAEADSDGDGLDNATEYRAGTQPTNAASQLALRSVVTAGTNLLLTWQTAGVRTNIVQMAVGSFSNFGDASGPIVIGAAGDASTNFTIPSSSNGLPQFFRIRLP